MPDTLALPSAVSDSQVDGVRAIEGEDWTFTGLLLDDNIIGSICHRGEHIVGGIWPAQIDGGFATVNLGAELTPLKVCILSRETDSNKVGQPCRPGQVRAFLKGAIISGGDTVSGTHSRTETDDL